MKIQIVYLCYQDIAQETFTTDDPLGAMEIRGFKFSGKVGGDHLREELRGKPSFTEVWGPMWGGDREGEPVIRYETPEAYRVLSA